MTKYLQAKRYGCALSPKLAYFHQTFPLKSQVAMGEGEVERLF